MKKIIILLICLLNLTSFADISFDFVKSANISRGTHGGNVDVYKVNLSSSEYNFFEIAYSPFYNEDISKPIEFYISPFGSPVNTPSYVDSFSVPYLCFEPSTGDWGRIEVERTNAKQKSGTTGSPDFSNPYYQWQNLATSSTLLNIPNNDTIIFQLALCDDCVVLTVKSGDDYLVSDKFYLTGDLDFYLATADISRVKSFNAYYIPEPSTYATIFGAIAIGCAVFARRKTK